MTRGDEARSTAHFRGTDDARSTGAHFSGSDDARSTAHFKKIKEEKAC